MTEYVCTQGHDACDKMYPSKECPYCEKKPVKRMTPEERRELKRARTSLAMLMRELPYAGERRDKAIKDILDTTYELDHIINQILAAEATIKRLTKRKI